MLFNIIIGYHFSNSHFLMDIEKEDIEKDEFVELMRNKLNLTFYKEYRFHPSRKWRFDYACPEKKIAVEVEGGSWCGGRHTSGAGFNKDREKYGTGTLMGWRIFRTIPQELLSDEFILMLKLNNLEMNGVLNQDHLFYLENLRKQNKLKKKKRKKNNPVL